ncbi:CNNM domain-containing protein [Myroides sp. M-43]|uniref:CNNM domain-containing protein n=1 Tax=Myroides oncorhynchi TaxID=2893756 RepID=UPI001E41F0A9|nr:CNNM domain-containing protein [Myroides oncorhynchi]MCC9043464.1 CNNM domain-containing protein [Myroides oncorhynchi]
MTLLLVYLFLALAVSFICSIAEATLLSLSTSFLKTKVESGDKKALKMIELKQDVDKPLSAILSLNTIAHTVGAAGVGAQATIVFGEAYFGVVSAVLTLLILVLTEIIPKTLGANYAKDIYGSMASTILVMMIVSYPLVVMSSFLTKRLSKKTTESSTSREEIAILASIGEQEGIIAVKENKIIQNVFKLNAVRIDEIHTPRIMMVSADQEMTLREFLKNKELLHFSRIPVYSDSKDNITGYVLREVAFEYLAEDRFDVKLKDIKRKILFVSEKLNVITTWNKMKENHEHIAIVVNEYGEVDGVVTMEDILETLLGFEIVDEKDKIVDLRQFAEERWQNRQKKYAYLAEDK